MSHTSIIESFLFNNDVSMIKYSDEKTLITLNDTISKDDIRDWVSFLSEYLNNYRYLKIIPPKVLINWKNLSSNKKKFLISLCSEYSCLYILNYAELA